MELLVDGQRIVTSPVREIRRDQHSDGPVH
jgi:hypothetical protein